MKNIAAINQERRKISELKPAEYNPRKRLQPGDSEYEALKRSIETFGYVDPIIVNKERRRHGIYHTQQPGRLIFYGHVRLHRSEANAIPERWYD